MPAAPPIREGRRNKNNNLKLAKGPSVKKIRIVMLALVAIASLAVFQPASASIITYRCFDTTLGIWVSYGWVWLNDGDPGSYYIQTGDCT